MKKIGSCQLLKTVCLVILGGLLVMGLAGCDVKKNSRAYLEGKAAELERVFPTENLEDLFEEFPGGFELETTFWYKETDKASYRQDLLLKGDPETKRISGSILNVKSESEPRYHEKILKESGVRYEDRQLKIENPDFKPTDVMAKNFLLTTLQIDKEFLHNLKLISKEYSFESGNGELIYQINNDSVSRVFGNTEAVDSTLRIGLPDDFLSGFQFVSSVTLKENGLEYNEVFRELKGVRDNGK
ncbi:hypothetical protein [Streptococcus thoraltensis]